MIERWGIIFGDLLIMLGVVALFGLVELGVAQAVALIVIGLAGVASGLFGDEARARNYFQVVAAGAGLGLVMALGAALSGSHVLFGVHLTTGSFILFVIVVAATFFAGFEPEALDETVLTPQQS
jgi:hypothetical protein